ncbi:hypothetical protein NFI96_013089 [Prochilodus magdalenae]|nr:hypothetical protein NFI96_013089 [Prochilodus magdalenae]
MATINSVYSNTQANVFFYIVTLRDAIKLIRRYIERTKLKEIRYKILEFNPMVLKGKLDFFFFFFFKLCEILPAPARPSVTIGELFTWMMNVIVQGDYPGASTVSGLWNRAMQLPFASDCDLPSTHEMVHAVRLHWVSWTTGSRRSGALGINPSDCSFNPGPSVFVADVGEWKKQKITKQLEKWMSKNLQVGSEECFSCVLRSVLCKQICLLYFPGIWSVSVVYCMLCAFRENLYSSAMAGGVATPPMLKCVFTTDTPPSTPGEVARQTPGWVSRTPAKPPQCRTARSSVGVKGSQWLPVRADVATASAHTGWAAGWSPDTRYAESFLQEANLLHWNGHFKPWDYPCVHLDLWEKWYIPDPSGKFSLVRPEM